MAMFETDPMTQYTPAAGGSPFRPASPPPPPTGIDDIWQSGPDGPPTEGVQSFGRMGQMQEMASNFGVGRTGFGARGPMGTQGGFAQLLAMRARLAGQRPEEMVGPGSGQQQQQAPMGLGRGYGQMAPMMRSGMFGMGAPAGMAGGMAGALAALKGKQDEAALGMGQNAGQDQMAMLMDRFRPLAAMGMR